MTEKYEISTLWKLNPTKAWWKAFYILETFKTYFCTFCEFWKRNFFINAPSLKSNELQILCQSISTICLHPLFWTKVYLAISKFNLLVNSLVNSFEFDISIQIVNWARHILHRHNCTNFVIWLKFNHNGSLLKHFIRHNVEKNWGRWWHKFSDGLVKFFNSENTLTKKSQAEFDFCHTWRRYCNVNVWWAENKIK